MRVNMMRLFLLFLCMFLQVSALDYQYKINRSVEKKLMKNERINPAAKVEKAFADFFSEIDKTLTFKFDRKTSQLTVSGEEENVKGFEYVFLSFFEWKPTLDINYELFIIHGSRLYSLAKFNGPALFKDNRIKTEKNYTFESGSHQYISDISIRPYLRKNDDECKLTLHADHEVNTNETQKAISFTGEVSLRNNREEVFTLARTSDLINGYKRNVYLRVKVSWSCKNSYFYKTLPEIFEQEDHSICVKQVNSDLFENEELKVSPEEYFSNFGLDVDGQNCLKVDKDKHRILLKGDEENVGLFNQVLSFGRIELNSYISELKVYKTNSRGADIIAHSKTPVTFGYPSKLSNTSMAENSVGLTSIQRIVNDLRNVGLELELNLTGLKKTEFEEFYPETKLKTFKEIELGEENIFQWNDELIVSIKLTPMNYKNLNSDEIDILWDGGQTREDWMFKLAQLGVDISKITFGPNKEILSGGPILTLLNNNLKRSSAKYRIRLIESVQKYKANIDFPTIEQLLTKGKLIKEMGGFLSTSGDKVKSESVNLEKSLIYNEDLNVSGNVDKGVCHLKLSFEENDIKRKQKWLLGRDIKFPANEKFLELISSHTKGGYLYRTFMLIELVQPKVSVTHINRVAKLYSLNALRYPAFKDKSFAEVMTSNNIEINNELIVKEFSDEALLYVLGTEKQHKEMAEIFSSFKDVFRRFEVYEVFNSNLASGQSFSFVNTEQAISAEESLPQSDFDLDEGIKVTLNKELQQFAVTWQSRKANALKTALNTVNFETSLENEAIYKLENGSKLLIRLIEH